MSSGRKCKNCGSFDIEVDPARGDAVCTNCGSVLEDTIIVSEIQFEDGNHGSTNAIGQFVSASSKGGGGKFGPGFQFQSGEESREYTLKKARNSISILCNQLHLNQHCIDTACNFYKMALTRNMTKGRKSTHIHAACVYLTCRTEGTAHLLIDICDVVQISCFELGRTYLKLSHTLCLNIPSIDPCLYILRFASKLEFGSKTQEVANTALRLVQRMKRDSLHSGRRPSGLCGAALLMAARLHEFNRLPTDIVKIVKVHETTLRKRMIEFGETPSSSLTLDEFLTVDLEEEQDPPSFKMARKKDKERLQRLMDEEGDTLTDLQKEIENQLIRDNKSKKAKRATGEKKSDGGQDNDMMNFIEEETVGTISSLISGEPIDDPDLDDEEFPKELGPNIESLGLVNSLEDVVSVPKASAPIDLGDETFDDLDDGELDSYIFTEDEGRNKSTLWHKINAPYLEKLKEREEKLAREKEEGKPEKKKRRVVRSKKNLAPSGSAGEAIEKMLQEKRISSKINYDVLKSLTTPSAHGENSTEPSSPSVDSGSLIRFDYKRRRNPTSTGGETPKKIAKTTGRGRKAKEKESFGLPVVDEAPAPAKEQQQPPTNDQKKDDHASEDDYEDFEEPEEVQPEIGVMQLLQQHRDDDDEAEMYFGTGYDEDDY
ncbi:PREDICTED: transcription factor IIIB 90 kDa subunit isoform X2 [Nicrophorus vespilloides]|uniref:B-related factor 1 n=1 Tax=Nicrophorus vespilloides TaxID=110193 RepID=A0ABM1MUL6_NICVS|nr:PREDICTED: transcription factor IIIB 90 kDa subunit isoform X2 [Nicrophorus vespilloides]